MKFLKTAEAIPLMGLLFLHSSAEAQNPGETKVNPKDGLTYVWIPPGMVEMGCSPGDRECGPEELPPHDVTISKGFWLGQTPVTQQAHQRVTGLNRSHSKGFNLPVDTVNWNEATAYCAAIKGQLPTEAQWEYAERAGSTGPRYGILDNIGWYYGNSGNKPHDVGQKLPNAFGLYDMLGNVSQWVRDWYGKYKPGAVKDPAGPKSGQFRVVRGGSWNHHPGVLRASTRNSGGPGGSGSTLGFRCVAK